MLGYYLILLLGRNGVFGPVLQELGLQFMFSWQGAVVAATVVVFPLIYKSAKTALEQVDANVEKAARTLGASEIAVFFSISLPLAGRGILSGAMLAFARGMGEFGGEPLCWPAIFRAKPRPPPSPSTTPFKPATTRWPPGSSILTSCICAAILVTADYLLGGSGDRSFPFKPRSRGGTGPFPRRQPQKFRLASGSLRPFRIGEKPLPCK